MNRITFLTLAWLSVLAGILGIVVPFLPGIPLLLIGLVLLARHYPWAGKLVQRLRSEIARFRNHYARHVA